MNDRVAVPAGDGYALVGPIGSALIARALAVVERQHRLSGVQPPVEWSRLRVVIDQAAAFAIEAAKARSLSAVQPSVQVDTSDRVGAERVAELAGCSHQWARALCRRGEFATARRWGSTWSVDENEVVAWAVVRAARLEAAA